MNFQSCNEYFEGLNKTMRSEKSELSRIRLPLFAPPLLNI